MNTKLLQESIMKNVAKELNKVLNEGQVVSAPHVSEVASIDLSHDGFAHHLMMVDSASGSATVYGFDSVDDFINMYYSEDDSDYPEVRWIEINTGVAGETYYDMQTDSHYFMID